MTDGEKRRQSVLVGPRGKERINTQIHRRRTVKAMSPLELEWEGSKSTFSSTTQKPPEVVK